MSLASEIAAAIQRLSTDVRVAGSAVAEVVEISTSCGFAQANAQASLVCPARPAWAVEGQAVEIRAGYNGATALLFRGEISGLSWEDGPGRVTLDCRDLLARTRLPWGGDDVEEWNIDSAALVRHILEIYGIPSSMAHIEGSGWILGTISPVTLANGAVGWSLISRVDALEGYRTYTDSAGVIRRTRVALAPGAGAALRIGPAQLLERPRRTRTSDGIVNRCIVTGISIAGITVGGPGVAEAEAPNPYLPDPPGFVTETIQDDLIEDDATALAIARRIVADKNRRPEGLELTIVGDPRIQPAWTLAVTEEALETGGAANTFVAQVAHRIGTTFTTSLRTTGGSLSGEVSGVPPVAVFDLQLFLEACDTGSGVAGLIVGVADGSQSADPDGTIVSEAWTIAARGATPDPTIASGPVCRFTVPATATDLTVTLMVTDNDGLTGVLSRTIPIDLRTMLVEDLYTAEGSRVACSSDGEQTWREATPMSGHATCLAPFGPTWGQCWGTDSGHIVATFDKLATLIDLGQPHGAVACTAVWVHEQDATRLWAGFADGDVWSAIVDSAACAATWSRAGTVGAGPVYEIRETLAADGSLRATVGAGYYASEDAGRSWALRHTFSAQAWRMAAGFDLNLASGLDSDPPIAAEETAPTVPAGVTHIRGLTFGWRTRALYAADDAAILYATDDTLSTLTATPDSAPAGVNHMIRSGNIDGVVYLACGDGSGLNGAAKWLPGTKAPFFVRRSDSRPTYMVSYGPAHLPPLAVTLLMVGSPGGFGHGVWRWQAGAWTDVSGNLPVQGWRGVVASPVSRSDWIVYAHDSAYRTTDAGATWSLLSGIGAGNLNAGLGLAEGITGAAFSADGSQWALIGSGGDTGSLVEVGFLTVGAGIAASATTTWYVAHFGGAVDRGAPRACVWVGSTIVVAVSSEVAGSASWHRHAGAAPSSGAVSSTSDDVRVRALDRQPFTPVVLGATHDPSTRTGEIWRAADATSSAASLALTVPEGDGSTMLAAAVDGLYVATSAGVRQVAYALGSAPVVALRGLPVAWVRSDRQRQAAVAALHVAGGQIAVYDGATWTTIAPPGPCGGGGDPFMPYVEIIS